MLIAYQYQPNEPKLISRYQPTAQEQKLNQHLYTKTAIAKLLKIKSTDIEFIYPMSGDRVLISTYSHNTYILNRKDFVKLNQSDRKARSRQIKVTQNVFKSEVFRARNDSRTYNVELYRDCITCQCQDYLDQASAFGSQQVACKHSYAVLNHLGYGSLKDYLKYQKSQNVIGVILPQLA